MFAQDGIPVLDAAKGKRVSFHYSYSLSRGGEAFAPVTDGKVLVQDNAYTLEGLGLKVISDGYSRWTLDSDAEELLIETVQDNDIFTNPALFLATYRSYMDKIKVNSQGADSLDITLSLDTDTKARFILKGISYSEKEDGKSDFSLDEKSLPSNFVVTDLR